MQNAKLTGLRYLKSTNKAYDFLDKSTGKQVKGESLTHAFLSNDSDLVILKDNIKSPTTFVKGDQYDVELSAYAYDRKTGVATGTLATLT